MSRSDDHVAGAVGTADTPVDAQALLGTHQFAEAASAQLVRSIDDDCRVRLELWPTRSPQDENCQASARHALLVLQVLVGGHEDVEAGIISRREQGSVLQCRPAAFVRRLDACAGNSRRNGAGVP
jgi:hypothetical protein